MKRLIVLLVVCSMLICAVPVFAEGTTISVSPPKVPVKAGDTFTVTVDISGNPGLCAAQLTLAFDKAQMECTDASTGNILSGALAATNAKAASGAIIAAAAVSALQGDGILASFTFKALKDIDTFEFNILNASFADSTGKTIEYTLSGVTSNNAEPEQKQEDQKTEDNPSVTPDPSKEQKQESENGNTSGSEAETKTEEKKDDSQSSQDAGSDTEEKKEDTSQSQVVVIKTDEKTETAEETEKTDTDKTEETSTQPAVNIDEVFSDVKDYWGKDYITKAYTLGLFSGYGNGKFGPTDNITRAQFVTAVYRMAGSPEPQGTSPFVDVSGQLSEFQKAIAWAYENKVVSGRDTTHFDPDGLLTRQEAITLMFNYSGGVSGMEGLYSQIYEDHYSDFEDVSSWAKSAVYWSIYNKIMTGTSEDTLSPVNTIDRGSIAKVLVMFNESF